MATLAQTQKAIAILMAAYPNTDGKTREAMEPFLKMVERVLAPYPAEVLDAMVHPRMGIISRCSFFPSIAEIKQFCDREWDRLSPRVVQDRADDVKQLYGRVEPDAAEDETKAKRRAQVLAGFKDLIAELSMAPDPMRKADTPPRSKVEEKAAAEAWLAAQAVRAVTEAPPRLSERALRAYWLVG